VANALVKWNIRRTRGIRRRRTRIVQHYQVSGVTSQDVRMSKPYQAQPNSKTCQGSLHSNLSSTNTTAGEFNPSTIEDPSWSRTSMPEFDYTMVGLDSMMDLFDSIARNVDLTHEGLDFTSWFNSDVRDFNSTTEDFDPNNNNNS